MSDILALGITHFPLLMGQDERMAHILKRMLQNPNLPDDLRDPVNWPAQMQAEWGSDEGATAAADHRSQLVDWLIRARSALDAFNPDFILMWGDDQYENFREDVIPPYCVNAHEKFEYSIPQNNIWGVPHDHKFPLAGHAEAGKYLAGKLIEAGFDTAYSYKPLHRDLGHAFGNGIFYLDYERRGFPYRVVPMSVNCYGNHVIAQRGGLPDFNKPLQPEDLDPPAPTPKRLFDLGAETARILVESPWRVAVIASSGWSHAFLVAKNHYLHPDSQADRRMYDALIAGDFDTWRNYPAHSVEESGQQEMLNWMCLAGALCALERLPCEHGFVDTGIFNSTKPFIIAPPAIQPVAMSVAYEAA